ncbi:MAG: aspartate-semialdehyde dehydrogenase [Holosporales bacterium]|nr:aspartate-semialdehyde dehydrogenase [Holosporales bacterium]
MLYYRIAIIGVTGNAGQALLEILFQRQFPVKNLTVFASTRSQGKRAAFGSSLLRIEALDNADFSAFDIAFFCAGAEVSRFYVPKAAQAGCIVIDKSSAFRDHPQVPLIVPEVNGEVLTSGAPLGIIANPNCIAIPLSMTLAPLRTFGLKRVVVSTYQSVSGAGQRACETLRRQTEEILQDASCNQLTSEKSIGFNVIPCIGDIEETGFSGEESKIMTETQKILQHPCGMCVTSVRVPVFVGHSMSVTAECAYPCAFETLSQTFQETPGVCLERTSFRTPKEVSGTDTIFISRLRQDPSIAFGVVFWVVADNLRKGAATNGVQIAEALITKDPTLSLFRKRKGEKRGISRRDQRLHKFLEGI